MPEETGSFEREPERALVTVAALRRLEEGGVEALFNERHRIYRLDEGDERAYEMLREVEDRARPLAVVLEPWEGRVLEVEEASKGELEEFERGRELLDEVEEIRALDLDSVDPTVFNVVPHGLDFKVFQLCEKVIPSYVEAKKIFDFCAKQTCSLGGPFQINPCIPFQYVIDGCYARAHKMRWVITTKYDYCCEKVFSFANEFPDRLAVQANKWGGCCVTWWYHVAPLVRVRVTLGTFSVVLAMVIDPGMFDKPVLLTSWLAAQENALCDPDANVSMYTIQPGSAYTPANYAGTMFTTDPNYVQTDATLIAYQNLITCP